MGEYVSFSATAGLESKYGDDMIDEYMRFVWSNDEQSAVSNIPILFKAYTRKLSLWEFIKLKLTNTL